MLLFHWIRLLLGVCGEFNGSGSVNEHSQHGPSVKDNSAIDIFADRLLTG